MRLKPKKGDLFYLIDVDKKGDKRRRKYKITCAFLHLFWWNKFWIFREDFNFIDSLQSNPDKADRVKWILYV